MRGFARTTVLIAAAGCGVAAAVLIYLYEFGAWKKPEKTGRVVVADTLISASTVISRDMIRIVTVPASKIQPDAATTPREVLDMVTINPVRKGEQIVKSNLVAKSTAFGLAALIPHGTRAMTITVDAADAVSGFLQPGNHVDVIAVFTEGQDSIARTILQDVKLLAVNESLRPERRVEGEQAAQEADKMTRANAEQPTFMKVTIAATPAEAERLVAAQFKGKLKIGLRGLNDASRFVTQGASLSKILGIPQREPAVIVRPQPVSARPRKAASPSKVLRVTEMKTLRPVLPVTPLPAPIKMSETVKVIKGSQVQEVNVEP